MSANFFVKNPISPLHLLKNDFLNKESVNIVLKEDIWRKNTLILKSGISLTREIIDKIAKFGIAEIYVNFEKKINLNENDVNSLKDKYISSQKVLILENDMTNLGFIVNNLIKRGFSDDNLFFESSIKSINGYLTNYYNFAFIDFNSLNELNESEIETVLLCKNKFLMSDFDLDKNKTLALDETTKHINAQVVIKPVIATYFDYIIDKAIEESFGEWIKDNHINELEFCA